MYGLVFFLAIAALGSAQYRGSPETAAIISDSRYLSGDGTFGSAYTQEDGVEFKEESDADGNRRGSYSYVDPSGQRRTITYTAGKNGFQASGDHLPVPPAPAPAPQPQYQPQPQYNPQQYYQPRPQYVQPQIPAQPRYQPQYAAPAQFDDGQYREEYNNPSYRPQVAQPVQAAAPSPQFSYSFGATPAPPAYAGVPQQFPVAAAAPQPAAHRFFPPGKLNLNRTPDGFSYTFNKS